MFSPERNLVESAYHLSIEFRDLDMGPDLELDNKGCPKKFLFLVAIAT